MSRVGIHKIAAAIASTGIKEMTALVDSKQAAGILSGLAPMLRLRGVNVTAAFSDLSLSMVAGMDVDVFETSPDDTIRVTDAVLDGYTKYYREWYLRSGSDITLLRSEIFKVHEDQHGLSVIGIRGYSQAEILPVEYRQVRERIVSIPIPAGLAGYQMAREQVLHWTGRVSQRRSLSLQTRGR